MMITLRSLIYRINSAQKRMDNIERYKYEKRNKEILKMKTTVTDMKNMFGGIFNHPDTAEERICEFEVKNYQAYQAWRVLHLIPTTIK